MRKTSETVRMSALGEAEEDGVWTKWKRVMEIDVNAPFTAP